MHIFIIIIIGGALLFSAVGHLKNHGRQSVSSGKCSDLGPLVVPLFDLRGLFKKLLLQEYQMVPVVIVAAIVSFMTVVTLMTEVTLVTVVTLVAVVTLATVEKVVNNIVIK